MIVRVRCKGIEYTYDALWTSFDEKTKTLVIVVDEWEFSFLDCEKVDEDEYIAIDYSTGTRPMHIKNMVDKMSDIWRTSCCMGESLYDIALRLGRESN